MITDINIVLSPDDESNSKIIEYLLFNALKAKKIAANAENTVYKLDKRSIDARHGKVKIYLRYTVYINEDPGKNSGQNPPVWKQVPDAAQRVIIVGAGPAGLFGALRLLEDGIKPVIIERGTTTSLRKQDIASISTKNKVDDNSNYCFGEGGAGTFSDGKLYTRSNKRGDIGKILRILNFFGADKSILTAAHPHIGTDKLPAVINAMQKKITELGGKFHFNTKCVSLITEKNMVKGIKCIQVKTDEELDFFGDAVLLATGHSAFDVYEMLAKAAPHALEAKTFAIGVRIEHPRTLIDSIQYHDKKTADSMGAAEYRLTMQADGRGVYSFCMCPGGFVVPSATGADEIVVNGMSASKRNSKWSNSAIVVETRPEDIPEKYQIQADKTGCRALAGLYFRAAIERDAKQHGDGQSAPAQRLTDFLAHKKSDTLPPSSYAPGIFSGRLDEWLPPHIEKRLEKAFPEFEKKMHGFISREAGLIAPETRTSTPVRILRDKETFECTVLRHLYPAGEGSGYSGGIVSSAMDGENCCAAISKKLHR